MVHPNAHILIVEDEPVVAFGLTIMVEAMGYSVVGPCQNLQGGLRGAEADDLDFALLDYDLGHGTDSLPIAALLSARAVPFAFVTGTSEEDIWRHLPDAVIIPKPPSESALEAALSSVSARYGVSGTRRWQTTPVASKTRSTAPGSSRPR